MSHLTLILQGLDHRVFLDHSLVTVKVTVHYFLSFCDSVQADDRIRIEKRDSTQFEYSTAMVTVTNFYSSVTHQTAEDQEKGNCLLFFFVYTCGCVSALSF